MIFNCLHYKILFLGKGASNYVGLLILMVLGVSSISKTLNNIWTTIHEVRAFQITIIACPMKCWNGEISTMNPKFGVTKRAMCNIGGFYAILIV